MGLFSDWEPWEKQFWLGALVIFVVLALGTTTLVALGHASCNERCTYDGRYGDYRESCFCLDEDGNSYRPKPRRGDR